VGQAIVLCRLPCSHEWQAKKTDGLPHDFLLPPGSVSQVDTHQAPIVLTAAWEMRRLAVLCIMELSRSPAVSLSPDVVLPVPEMAEICRRYGVKELSVFGSAARGDMQLGSDIDLLVEFEPGSHVGLFELWDLNDELEKLLNRRVDLVTKDGLKRLIRSEVLREARPLYAA